MRSSHLILIVLLIFIVSGTALARDTKHLFLISDAMNTAAANERLTGGVEFYFGSQKHPGIKQSYGEHYTNKKTNAFNKDDKTACEWVFVSAMIALQETAQQLGADAIVNIHSYYKKIAFESETEYECHAGGLMAGVALRGTFVKSGISGVSGNTGGDASSSTSNLDPLVKEMQRKLTVYGYDPGPVDGYLGQKTSEAIKEFQVENRLAVTGELDDKTISAIRNSGSASGKNIPAAKSTVSTPDNSTSSNNTADTQNKCTVEQILELQKIGLTTEQISSACDT